MTKQNLLKIISLFFIITLISCEGDETVKFRFTDLDLQTVSSAQGIPVVVTDSIPAAVFGIRLLLYPEETFRKGRYFDTYESQVYNEDPITNIKIWCNRALNSDTAGTILNNYFIYVPENYLYAMSLDKGLHPTARYNSDYETNNIPDHADLLLRTPPLPGNYKFYVELQMYNGGIYKDSTSLIRLY